MVSPAHFARASNEKSQIAAELQVFGGCQFEARAANFSKENI